MSGISTKKFAVQLTSQQCRKDSVSNGAYSVSYNKRLTPKGPLRNNKTIYQNCEN